LKRLQLRSRAGDFLNTSGAGNHGIALDEGWSSGKCPAASDQWPGQFVKIFCQISGKALDRKNLFSRLNEVANELSNLKRPVYGHTSSVPE
jgi:hypothetical protein